MEKIIIPEREKTKLIKAYNKSVKKAKDIKKDISLLEKEFKNINLELSIVSPEVFEAYKTKLIKRIKISFWNKILKNYAYLKIPFTYYEYLKRFYKQKQRDINEETLKQFENLNIERIWKEFFDVTYSERGLNIIDGRDVHGSLNEKIKNLVRSYDLFGLLMDRRKDISENLIKTNFLHDGTIYKTDYLILRTFKGDKRKVRVRFRKNLRKYVKNFLRQLFLNEIAKRG